MHDKKNGRYRPVPVLTAIAFLLDFCTLVVANKSGHARTKYEADQQQKISERRFVANCLTFLDELRHLQFLASAIVTLLVKG